MLFRIDYRRRRLSAILLNSHMRLKSEKKETISEVFHPAFSNYFFKLYKAWTVIVKRKYCAHIAYRNMVYHEYIFMHIHIFR